MNHESFLRNHVTGTLVPAPLRCKFDVTHRVGTTRRAANAPSCRQRNGADNELIEHGKPVTVIATNTIGGTKARIKEHHMVFLQALEVKKGLKKCAITAAEAFSQHPATEPYYKLAFLSKGTANFVNRNGKNGVLLQKAALTMLLKMLYHKHIGKASWLTHITL